MPSTSLNPQAAARQGPSNVRDPWLALSRWDWERILQEAKAKGQEGRAAYARWMLEEVLEERRAWLRHESITPTAGSTATPTETGK